eukprot:scaffold48_cov395-Prasinococcus_capsulatus_cf.AAC.30
MPVDSGPSSLKLKRFRTSGASSKMRWKNLMPLPCRSTATSFHVSCTSVICLSVSGIVLGPRTGASGTARRSHVGWRFAGGGAFLFMAGVDKATPPSHPQQLRIRLTARCWPGAHARADNRPAARVVQRAPRRRHRARGRGRGLMLVLMGGAAWPPERPKGPAARGD